MGLGSDTLLIVVLINSTGFLSFYRETLFRLFYVLMQMNHMQFLLTNVESSTGLEIMLLLATVLTVTSIEITFFPEQAM